MNPRRDRWPAIGLALQLMGGEFQPRVLHANESGTTAARYAVLLLGAIVPLGVVVVRSTMLHVVLRRPPLNWLAAYLSWVCLAVVWSIDPTHALQPAAWIVSVSLYTIWFVSRQGWRAFEETFAVTASAYIGVGVLVEAINGLGNGRLQGLMLAATAMGRLGGILCIIGTSIWNRGHGQRALGAISILFGLYAIYASSTRIAAFALLVIGAWAFLRRAGRSGVLVLTVVIVSVAFAFAFAADSGIVIVTRTPDGTDFVQQRNGILVLEHTPGGSEYTTGTGRTSVWNAAWHEIEQRPVFGWGTGSSDRLFQELAAEGRLNWIAVTAHNTPLQILVEYGAIGFGLFLGAIWAYRRASRTTPSTVRTALVIFLVIDGVGESLLDIGRVPLLVVAAVFAAAANDAVSAPRTRTRSARRTTPIGALQAK